MKKKSLFKRVSGVLTGVFFSIAQPQGGGKGIVSLPVL